MDEDQPLNPSSDGASEPTPPASTPRRLRAKSRVSPARQSGFLTSVSVFMGALALASVFRYFHLHPWFMGVWITWIAYGGVVWSLAPYMRRRRSPALQVELKNDGVRLWTVWHGAETIAYEDIRAVKFERREVVLDTARGLRTLGRALPQYRGIGAWIEARIAGEPPVATTDDSDFDGLVAARAAELAAKLDGAAFPIPRSAGGLVRDLILMCPFAFVATYLLTLSTVVDLEDWFQLAASAVLAGAGLADLNAARRWQRYTVTADGLCLRGRRGNLDVAWAEVASVAPRRGGWTLRTHTMDLPIPDTEAGRALHDFVVWTLAQREQHGVVDPIPQRLSGSVPDEAISLTSGPSASDAGLSPTDPLSAFERIGKGLRDASRRAHGWASVGAKLAGGGLNLHA